MTDEAENEPEVEETEGEEGEAVAKKGGRKKLFIIIGAAALVVLLGGGAAAYFLLFSAGPSPEENKFAELKPAAFFDMPPMTVNLSSPDDQGGQFLKLTVSLELPDEAAVEAITPRMPQVADAFQVYLRELRRSDLEGSAGIYRLKEELRRRVNLAIYPVEVTNILFKEILVQ